jgi:deoxyribonuclease IV
MSSPASKSAPTILLGAHMSIAGGTFLAIERAAQVGCTVLQIFVKNNNRWQGRSLSAEEAEEFKRRRSCSRLARIVAHDCYLINLASPQEALWSRSITALAEEMERCARLGVDLLVVHPGCHSGAGEIAGVRRVAQALDQVFDQTAGGGVRIALETTAGQGTSLGYRFQQLRDILDASRESHRLDVCLDTCHLFAAGYDLRDPESYERTMESFSEAVGFSRLAVLHLNDSKRPFGSRVDRHEHIGKGQIGTAGFACIMNDRRLAAVPKLIETPKGKTLREDRRNLRLLRSLVVSGPSASPR